MDKKNTEEFYENVYKKFDYVNYYKHNKIALYRLKKVIDVVRSKIKWSEDFKVLDVPCSTGEGLAIIPVRKENKFGIDIAKTGVVETKKKGFNAVSLDVESEKLPYKDNTFDIIFVMELLEHLFSIEQFMKEIKRVLKPKGYIVITVPNEILRYDSIIRFVFKRKIPCEYTNVLPHDHEHIRFFSKNSLQKLIKHYGFRKIFVSGLPLSYHCKKIPLGGFLSDRFTDMFTSNYIAIGKNDKH